MNRMRAWVAAVAIAVPVGSYGQSVDAAAITVGSVPGQAVQVLRDAYGRGITLRGFNVSGSAKLNESGFLPFRSTGRTPWIIRSQYESLDHGGNASDWWTAPGGRGSVLSSTSGIGTSTAAAITSS